MYISRILVKLDRNAFRSATEVEFQPVEKAEHQGCCGRIPPDSGRNRNPVLDSGTPTNRNENRNVPSDGTNIVIVLDNVLVTLTTKLRSIDRHHPPIKSVMH